MYQIQYNLTIVLRMKCQSLIFCYSNAKKNHCLVDEAVSSIDMIILYISGAKSYLTENNPFKCGQAAKMQIL